ncbi:MAG: YhdH/YhfP family quinone oxidoreductase [Burkholderiales bacterium]
MSGMFKALQVFSIDGRIAHRIVETTIEELDPGEVVIENQYSSVNYKDALAATGAGKIIRSFPKIAGIDCAGAVVHSSVADFRVGDSVVVTGHGLGAEHDGGFAEYVRVPAAWVVKLPPSLSCWEAMAIGTAGFTAALAILRMETMGLRPAPEPVVVTGATGGVGSIAVDLLAQRGYRVTAITRKAGEADYLRELGAHEVLALDGLVTGVNPLEKGRWAGAIDNVGGELLAWLIRTTLPWGVITSCGLTGGTEIRTTVMPFILRAVSLLGISAANCPMETRAGVWSSLATDMRPKHLARIATTIALEDLPHTFERLLAGEMKGRAVVRTGSVG